MNNIEENKQIFAEEQDSKIEDIIVSDFVYVAKNNWGNVTGLRDDYAVDVYEKGLEQYDQVYGKGRIISEEEKRNMLMRVEKEFSEQLSNPLNIIYLKIINLCSKILRLHGEDQELYYIFEKLVTSESDFCNKEEELEPIRLRMCDIFLEKGFESCCNEVITVKVCEDLIKPFKTALKTFENKLNKEEELEELESESEDFEFEPEDGLISDTLREIIEALEGIIDISQEDIIDFVTEKRKDDFEDKIFEQAEIRNFAEIYCMVHGSMFTSEEKAILKSYLHGEECNYLTSLSKRINKK